MTLRRSARAALNRTLARAVGEAGRYAHFHASMAVTAMSPQEVATAQVRQLRAVLEHAGLRVPYWRDLFRELRFDPSSVHEVSDLEALPLLDKATIRREGGRMLSDGWDRRRLLSRSTGGSTGEPLRFWCDREEYELQIAQCLRSFALVGVQPGDPTAKIWGYNAPQRVANAVAPLTGRLFFDAYRAAPSDMDQWLQAMRRARPKMIYGYASSLTHFARHVAERGAQLEGIEVAASTAEKLFPEQRQTIESCLGVRVVDMYGCHEVPRLASECLHGTMHRMSDAAVMEFADPQPSGGEGRRILVTSLSSFAMPFIRYDVGDSGRPVDVECACGLPFPAMAMDLGKAHEIFPLSDGEGIHTSYFFKRLYRIEAIDRFQIRQWAIDRIEVTAVARSDSAASALAEAINEFQARLGQRAQIVGTIVDEIPRTARGKQPIVLPMTRETPSDDTI